VTFAVRGVLVSLGFFGVLYCLLSLLVATLWRGAKLAPRMSAASYTRVLFWLRISPLLGSALVTLAFAMPAFFRLEPGTIDEDGGTLTFGICALLLLAAGLFRVVTTRAKTRRVVAGWMKDANVLEANVSVPTFQARAGIPPILLFGISEPAVLVSEATVSLLNEDELRVSIRHEVEHVRSRDNLKKLMIHCCPFPGMAALDRAWQEAAELAADEAAVANRGDAVDLAAALIKLSDLVPVYLPPAFTTGLVNAPVSVSLRVERLLAWDETRTGSRVRWWYALPFALVMLSYTVVDYGQALSLTHRLTEWFVH